METILICDDEKDIVSALNIYLRAEGWETVCAYSGREAVQIASEQNLQLILMDIMMPEMDGITAMTEIRKNSNVPIILLTAKSEDSDKILGLNVGADDYITKPFSPAEVVARVRSQLRRYLRLGAAETDAPNILTVGSISLNMKARSASLDGVPVALTPIEYEILSLLMHNVGTVFPPREIYSAVWKANPIGSENTVAVHIRHLREKLEINPQEPRQIKVVWGQGYKLEKP
ncbi:MAG: response regulator transcription factor [Oscillospiraceae bacterium]|nr:response regulator transcription factor [Oscillospiraceae bacterium]